MLRCQLTTGTSWWRRKETLSDRGSPKCSLPSAGVDGRVNGRVLFSLLVEAVFCFSLNHRTDALMTVTISGKSMPQCAALAGCSQPVQSAQDSNCVPQLHPPPHPKKKAYSKTHKCLISSRHNSGGYFTFKAVCVGDSEKVVCSHSYYLVGSLVGNMWMHSLFRKFLSIQTFCACQKGSGKDRKEASDRVLLMNLCPLSFILG